MKKPLSPISTPNYVIGTHCWIHIGNEDEDENPVLSEGIIIHILKLPLHTCLFYIIQMVEESYLFLEVRDALLMSPSEDESLAMYQCDGEL